jgi:hypothetical protein
MAGNILRVDFGPAPPTELTRPSALPTPGAPDGGSPTASSQVLSGLAGYIQTCYRTAADNRQNQGVDDRMMSALRALRGEYDAKTLSDIRNFGGSEIYARVIASKVRGCAALLREIYTATSQPWALSPTPDPSLAGPSVDETVRSILTAEVGEVQAAGAPMPSLEQVQERVTQLRDEIMQHRKKQAQDGLRTREAAINDIMWEGGFYEALWDILGDIATFPFAVMKGPVVRMKTQLEWQGRKPVAVAKPAMMWERCSPFDVYFAPWAQRPQDGFIIHRERMNRAAVQSLRDLPNYSKGAIDRVLANWNSNNCEWYDYNESERADLEQRESQISPIYSAEANEKPMPMLSFYGSVSGKMLADWGVDKKFVPDESKDMHVFAYLIGGEVIGVTLNPHPTGKLPFYVDSFERVPGSCYGNAIPDLLDDVQAVGNAALRALVNNLAVASGPMAWVNEDRIPENDPNATKLWPWKVFRFTDPMSANQTEKPMEFFQPDANIQGLFMVYQQMLNMADELSTIPRYMQGNGQGVGGAGRTAAGLSMLMEASNRTIKQTVTSIDHTIVESAVEDLNVYLALTRPDIVMEGDISVDARGATELMQRETLRMRRLEFLNITNNPIDQQLVGVEGRGNLLREISRDLALPTADTVAMNPQVAQQLQQMMLAQMMQAASGGGMNGNQPPPAKPGAPPQPTQGIARPQNNNPGV